MRITDSKVQFSIQHSVSRTQEQASQTQVEQTSAPLQDAQMQKAQLEFNAHDSVALSSQSQVLSQAVDGEAIAMDRTQELSSERVVQSVLSGEAAWQALSLHGAIAFGNVQLAAGHTVQLQVESAVTQQVQQQSLFTAQGSVTDGNGNEIRFQLGLQMQSQSELNAQSEFTLVTKPRTDPLVINFDAPSAQLGDTVFQFDLNADGRKETLAQLGSGSGYLVFDRNKNGVVDDGSELFGVASGDGFADLAQYDDDGNLWLDESDPMFADLSIWVNGDDGSSSLRSLHDLGVGAIYLGASGDDFELTSTLGVPLGNVRAHSVVLMENGDVRTAQQLDLVDLTPPAQSQNAQGQAIAAPQVLMQGVAVTMPDNTRANLQRLRLQQQDYRRQHRKEAEKKPKSLLEQLLLKMEQIRERYREIELRRERVMQRYRQD